MAHSKDFDVTLEVDQVGYITNVLENAGVAAQHS